MNNCRREGPRRRRPCSCKVVSSRQTSRERAPETRRTGLLLSPHNQGVPTCVSVGTSVTGRLAASHLTIGHGGRIPLADEQLGVQRLGSLSGVMEGVPLGATTRVPVSPVPVDGRLHARLWSPMPSDPRVRWSCFRQGQPSLRGTAVTSVRRPVLLVTASP